MFIGCLLGANSNLDTFTYNAFFTLTIHYREDIISLILKIIKLRFRMTTKVM